MRIRSLFLVIGLAAGHAAYGDWPQFRGPDGQGHAGDVSLPTKWSEQEGIRFKVSLPGQGWSSPIIVGGRIWMTTATEDGHSLRALSVDAQTGRLLHDVEVFRVSEPVRINPKNSHASPTPVADHERVYVHFGAMGTAALDLLTGKVLWRNEELLVDHKEGPGSSPILVGPLLVVNCDGIDHQYVAALDRRTGRIAWRTPRSGPMEDNTDFRKAYSTPLVIAVGGEELIVSPGAGRLAAYQPATGREAWTIFFKGFSTVPRPSFDGHRLFFCTGYMRPSLWAVRPDGAGDVTSSHVLWKLPDQVPANPSPILVDGQLYMVSDQGIASRVDCDTGKVTWKERLGGNYSASPISARNMIYFCSENGRTSIIEAGANPKVIARNDLDGRLLASPAVLGNDLFLRTTTHLYRIE